MIKELIEQVRNDSELIKQKEDELLVLENRCGVKAITFEEKNNASRNNNAHEQAILNYIQAKEELEQFKQSTIDNRIIVANLVYKLSSKANRNIMYDYCLRNKSVKQLAIDHCYTIRNIYIIINKSIEEMEKISQYFTKEVIK